MFQLVLPDTLFMKTFNLIRVAFLGSLAYGFLYMGLAVNLF